MKATILVQLELNQKNYDIKLDIPSTTPSPASPYLFIIADGASEQKTSLLEVAIGNEDNYFIGVEAPKDVFEMAKIEEIVKQLKVVASNGEYDPATHTFAP